MTTKYMLNISVSMVAVAAGTTVYAYDGHVPSDMLNPGVGRFAGKPHVAVTLEEGGSGYFVVPRSYLSALDEGYGARG